jgi:hypothetical protein
MSLASFDLEKLLAPLGAERFFSVTWERKHLLLSRGDPGYYDGLLSSADIENMISDTDARYPAIRLARGGRYLPAEAYTRTVRHGDETFAGVQDVRRIAEAYRSGATIALPALRRTWKPLGVLCAALQSRLDHAVHANADITPGGGRLLAALRHPRSLRPADCRQQALESALAPIWTRSWRAFWDGSVRPVLPRRNPFASPSR